jgi:hypothetical protein
MDEAARGAADREVKETHGLGSRDLLVLRKRAGQLGHARVDLLREDVRLEAGAAQVSLNGQGLVANGVAVGKCGQHLVDAARHALCRDSDRTMGSSRAWYFRSITGQE